MVKQSNKISTLLMRETHKEFRAFIVKDIFKLNHCWMRDEQNNRWLFAAMGLTIQMHQLNVFKKGRSTWDIKEQVLG
jgi:hypothetical protein